MNFKWAGPIGLLAALVIGDQIRINRPGHKYRLAVEVETPDGVKSASGVLAVHPDRGYSRRGSTLTRGDAVLVDLGGKKLFALLAHIGDNGLELDGMNYVALRAFNAAGRKTMFTEMNRIRGTAPVTGALIPVLAAFTDINDPATMRVVGPDDLEATYGKGFGLRGVSVEAVPNGIWPLDFGGVLGEPVTRGVEAKLPWWSGADDPAAAALTAAGLTSKQAIDAKEVFIRK
ncbi:hypothetical protein [Bradyrhizobium sp.]|jgi:hypothetical protein|uniref:hypothetical protein n=1 Tax=Bradyrhizobium sp. TaxID=376 RepID=UPI002E07D06A|nr:hypothetical protein [Bradyrhizobium sp.]